MKNCNDGYPSCRNAEATGTECRKDCVVELQRELDGLIQQRDKINAKMMERYRTHSATRARTTTSNAETSQINERISWLREELKIERYQSAKER